MLDLENNNNLKKSELCSEACIKSRELVSVPRWTLHYFTLFVPPCVNSALYIFSAIIPVQKNSCSLPPLFSPLFNFVFSLHFLSFLHSQALNLTGEQIHLEQNFFAISACAFFGWLVL